MVRLLGSSVGGGVERQARGTRAIAAGVHVRPHERFRRGGRGAGHLSVARIRRDARERRVLRRSRVGRRGAPRGAGGVRAARSWAGAHDQRAAMPRLTAENRGSRRDDQAKGGSEDGEEGPNAAQGRPAQSPGRRPAAPRPGRARDGQFGLPLGRAGSSAPHRVPRAHRTCLPNAAVRRLEETSLSRERSSTCDG